MESEDREILSKRSSRRPGGQDAGCGDRSQDHEGRTISSRSTLANCAARKAWPSAQTIRSCSAAMHRRPMGTGIPWSSIDERGGLDGPPGPRRRRRSLVQSGDGHYIIPSCNTAVPHCSSELAHHWSRVTRDRRLKRTPAGPIGYRSRSRTAPRLLPRVIRARYTRSQPIRANQIFLPIPAVAVPRRSSTRRFAIRSMHSITVVGTPNRCDRLYRHLQSETR